MVYINQSSSVILDERRGVICQISIVPQYVDNPCRMRAARIEETIYLGGLGVDHPFCVAGISVVDGPKSNPRISSRNEPSQPPSFSLLYIKVLQKTREPVAQYGETKAHPLR